VVQQVVVAAAALDASQNLVCAKGSAVVVKKDAAKTSAGRGSVVSANSVNERVMMLINVVPKNRLVRSAKQKNASGNKENVNAQKRLDVQQRKETSSLV
jgi:hypothetical protein